MRDPNDNRRRVYHAGCCLRGGPTVTDVDAGRGPDGGRNERDDHRHGFYQVVQRQLRRDLGHLRHILQLDEARGNGPGPFGRHRGHPGHNVRRNKCDKRQRPVYIYGGPDGHGRDAGRGPTAGGMSVVITGTNLTGATAVTFGGTAASSYTVNSATQITATAPARSAGTVDIRVTTAGGQSATNTGDRFTYMPAPTVTDVTPDAGPTAGGTSVVIIGTNLTGATAVSFGGTAASSFTVNSATQITATAPARSAGTVDITVTTASGTSTTSSSDRFAYIAAPTVTGVTPTVGPTAGGTSVVITGTNLSGATAVSFGGTAATSYTVNSATQITATSPARSAGTVDITVTTVGGTSATGASDRFTYMAAPTVTGVSPSGGPTAGGTSVVITGTNLTGATAVSFGGNGGDLYGQQRDAESRQRPRPMRLAPWTLR